MHMLVANAYMTGSILIPADTVFFDRGVVFMVLDSGG